MSALLAAAVVVSAALTVLAAPWALGLPALAWVFKPATTLLIVAHAWGRGREQPVLRRWVLAGLALSLLGDVALLWPAEGFVPGLVSFLLAHLAYLRAFTRVARLAAWWPPFAVYAAVTGAILAFVWPGVAAPLRGAVVAYVLCLSAMAAQAAVVWHAARGTPQARRAAALALGGALFVASDALLAVNRFVLPLPLSGLWILASYWSAQWCIASWLAPPRRPALSAAGGPA